MMTLDKIIGVLTVFTPEVGSAEFEMCAVGLEPRLNVTERERSTISSGKSAAATSRPSSPRLSGSRRRLPTALKGGK